jgi:hypothetical protein
MNRDEITRMAREAGFVGFDGDNGSLRRFAALVAAAEREKVARWQMGSGYSTGHGETIEDLLVELEWQVRESEREACAKAVLAIANDDAGNPYKQALRIGAETIRARGIV